MEGQKITGDIVHDLCQLGKNLCVECLIKHLNGQLEEVKSGTNQTIPDVIRLNQESCS